VYHYLYKKLTLKIVLDANDVTRSNFILTKEEKVYFVDIEGIKTKVEGFGIGKLFYSWAKTPQKRNSVLKGYLSVKSTSFLTKEYLDFLTLEFAIQRLNWTHQTGEKNAFDTSVTKINLILKKYF
jgi:thiamine kinase-like enzyme